IRCLRFLQGSFGGPKDRLDRIHRMDCDLQEELDRIHGISKDLRDSFQAENQLRISPLNRTISA
ncbi:MAG TPA: hypothetical protein PLE76_09200, partial [Rectinema sp.]|nr:hypothetical protein [Rectinema sp.]